MRVSDAMRRAGGGPDEAPPIPDDTTTFVASEDGEVTIVGGPADAPPVTPPPGDPPPAAPLHGEVLRAATPVLATPLFPTPSLPTIEIGRPDAERDVRLKEILRVLSRRKWLIAALVVLSTLGGAAYNRFATPIYEARARVVIEPSAAEVIPFRNTRGEDLSRQDYFVTQFEVLRSRTLAQKTLASVQLLDADPARHPGQIGRLLGSLEVTPSRSDLGDSRVVNVAVRDTDPKRAQLLANAVSQTYVTQNLEGLRSRANESLEWLNQQISQLRKDVTASDGAKQTFLEQRDAVSLQGEGNVVLEQFQQLSTALTAAQVERLQKETVFNQLTSLQRSGAPLDTFPAIQSNPNIQSIKAELATLERERERLSAEFLDGHESMIKVNTAIQNQQARLVAETTKLAESIANEYRSVQKNEQQLTAAFNDQKVAVLDLSRKAIPFNALERDAASTQKVFDAMVDKFKETELAAGLPSNNVRVMDAAELPGGPIWPRKQLNLALAVLFGGVVGVGLAFVLEFTNPRLAEPGEIASALGLPLLGATPKVAELGNEPAALSLLPMPFQEAVRNIRTHILLSPLSAGARTLAITSSRPGEGKTVISSSLAVAMAMAGRRVLLVDGDLRRAQIGRIFNVARAPGLSNVITGEVKPSQAFVETDVKGLFVMPAGDEVSNPGDLLEGERLSQLIRGLNRVFDLVIIDCTPVMAVADASIIASAAHGVVFIVGSGTTSREVAQTALDRLAGVRARVIGVVMNKTKSSANSAYFAPYYSAQDGPARA